MRTIEPSTITIHVPLSFAVRGGRKLILGNVALRAPQSEVHEALLKALARAYRWRNQIEGGDYASITELAKAEKINQSYACRLLRLTLLSPAIVEDILNGRQKPGVALRRVMRGFPLMWSQQAEVFSASSDARI